MLIRFLLDVDVNANKIVLTLFNETVFDSIYYPFIASLIVCVCLPLYSAKRYVTLYRNYY